MAGSPVPLSKGRTASDVTACGAASRLWPLDTNHDVMMSAAAHVTAATTLLCRLRAAVAGAVEVQARALTAAGRAAVLSPSGVVDAVCDAPAPAATYSTSPISR